MELDKVNTKYILFTSNNFPTGGAGATYLNLFCKGVKENAGDINVYLFKGYIFKNQKLNKFRKNKTTYGVNYIYQGFANRPHNRILKILEDILCLYRTTWVMFKLIPNRRKITVLVYSDEFLSNIPVYVISKLFRIKLVSFVFEFHDKEESKNLGLIKLIKWNLFYINYRFLNKLSDKLIVFSTFLKNEYLNKGYDAKNIIIQPNLTDLNGWYIPGQEVKYTIGYAGTPSKKDGIFDLISSIKLLKEKDIIITAIIIGDAVGSDSYLPKLRKLCEEIGISNQICFTGLVSQQEVKKYLNTCRILAITRPNTKQTQAGFPTKLGEYMACRKVVLATKFGDMEQYFTDKTDIVMGEPDNPISIAENILWILNNPEKSEIIAKNGFRKASEVLNYQTGAKKIMNSIRV